MAYDEFKQKIAHVLNDVDKPLAWTEIRTAARLPQLFPNNQWVHRLEKDIRLIRRREGDGTIHWEISKGAPTPKAQRPLKLPARSERVRAESKALWNDGRSRERADFFTVGYEGRGIHKLFETLRSAGVRCVLDIRYNPVSMYRPRVEQNKLPKIR